MSFTKEQQRASSRKSWVKHGARYRQQKRERYAATRDEQICRTKTWKLANPERSRATSRAWSKVNRQRISDGRRRRKGIPIPPYIAPQNCELCGAVSGKLKIDHDHITGAFRGWLCTRCNLGLGLLGDVKSGILLALRYLERKI